MIKAFEILDKLGKKPVIAQLGGFDFDKKIISSFGGGFLMPDNGGWPAGRFGPMRPLLQIAVDELPFAIEPLNNYKLLQIFLDRHALSEIHAPACCGEKWQIKTYTEISGLKKVDTPGAGGNSKGVQVKWSVGDTDYPCWEEAWNYADLSGILDDEHLREEYINKYRLCSNTKIGGYASYIQSPCLDGCDYILQITDEGITDFRFGDCGRLYFGIDKKGEWVLNWDCY